MDDETLIRREIKLQDKEMILRRYPRGVPINMSGKVISRHSVYRWSHYIKYMIEEERSQCRDELRLVYSLLILFSFKVS